MEKILIFSNRLQGAVLLANSLKAPLAWLCKYYSTVLERRLNLRQTGLLLNAQAAFVCMAFPVDGPWLLRAACLGWFVHAVLRCKEALR